LRLDCSPPRPGLEGPTTSPVFNGQAFLNNVTVTQDNGAAGTLNNVPFDCGEHALNVVTDPGSPAFELGSAELSLDWEVAWADPTVPLPPGCSGRQCLAAQFVGEVGTVTDAPTLVIRSGTQPTGVPASIQAIVAAEIGHLDLAYDYFRETAFIDLHDLAGNTADGLHLGSLAGTWLAAVAGFGGMRDHGDTLSFEPRLPAPLSRVCFGLVYRGRHLRVDIRPGRAYYALLEGEPIELLHEGQPITLAPGSGQVQLYRVPSDSLDVEPPPGRAPCRQGVGAEADSHPVIRRSSAAAS
jgi:hypothetical protein